MASFTSSGWAAGATVNAYAQDAFGNQTGASVASGTASSSGQVTLSGLADATKYVASDGTRKVRFQTPSPSAESGRAVISAGNLGAAYQLDMTGHHDVLVVGTLTANCTITVTGETPGCRYSFQLTQDATGGRTVTFPAAVLPAGPLAVNTTALVTSVVQFDYDGTNRIAWSSVMGTLDSLSTKRVAGATGASAATASGSAITATAVALPGKPTPNDYVGAFRLTMKATGMATGTLTTVTRSVAAGHAGLVILQPLNANAIAAQIYPNTFSNGQTFDVICNVAPAASSVIDFSYQYVE